VSGTDVSVAGFVLLGLVGAGLELTARATARVPTAGRSVAAAMRSTPGRVAVLVWWVWLGVHFLAR
jgi:hypothetical protein